ELPYVNRAYSSISQPQSLVVSTKARNCRSTSRKSDSSRFIDSAPAVRCSFLSGDSLRKEEARCCLDDCRVDERPVAESFGSTLALRIVRIADDFLPMAARPLADDWMFVVRRVSMWR